MKVSVIHEEITLFHKFRRTAVIDASEQTYLFYPTNAHNSFQTNDSNNVASYVQLLAELNNLEVYNI